MTYITTYSGKKLSLIDPQPEDICIEDIAYHLGSLCRFNGACRRFYSVAQHCVFVHDLVEDPIKFLALMHDAGEAYYGDMSSPFKQAMQELVGARWDIILYRVDKVICTAFELPFGTHYDIKIADRIALATEIRDLTCWDLTDMGIELPPPHLAPIVINHPNYAAKNFLKVYRSLQ